MHKLAALMTIALLVFLVACGGSSSNGGSTPPPVTQVKLNMTTASSLVGQTAQFAANVPVTWAVTESNGGSITSAGLYTAPKNVGSFHIVATSTQDKSKSATASVDVSAQFLSLAKNLSGASQPFSVTPVLNTLKSDASVTSTPLIDGETGNPIDSNVFDIYQSADGKKALLTTLTQGSYQGEAVYFYDLAMATATIDTNGVALVTITPVTHNETNQNSYVQDEFGQLSADGKTIVDAHYSSNPGGGEMAYWSIGFMNADGSNYREIQPQIAGYPPTVGTAFPTFSPDGTKIAFEMWGSNGNYSDNSWYDGIAIMNVDGSGLTQLTTYDATAGPCWGWDEMPAFNSDGTKIVFSRICFADSGGISEQLMSMNVDGSNIKAIHGGALGGFISCQPRTFANGAVVFSSNVEAPGTDSFDMYSVLPDGTKLTRVTNNNLYDGFSVWWMNYSEVTAEAQIYRSQGVVQQRLLHKKMLKEHKAVVK
jgi:Tol biopolymer transport system component